MTTAKEQGIKPDVFLRLIAAEYTPKDYAKYCLSPHFKLLKEQVFTSCLYEGKVRCIGCNQGATSIQHPPWLYKHLFDEPPHLLTPICARCNRKLRRR
jgi:hypothetical protein